MKCPFCQHPNTQVTDSRWLEDTNSIRRRRKCLECGQRFSTFETVEMRMPQVIKSNGTRVPFNAHKLQTSLERALHKRPVTQEQIDETVALIEQRLYRLGKKEVASRIVGEMAMEELHEKRVDFVQKVQQVVSEDLFKNGLELETVSLTDLNPNRFHYFHPSRICTCG